MISKVESILIGEPPFNPENHIGIEPKWYRKNEALRPGRSSSRVFVVARIVVAVTYRSRYSHSDS